jgi:hypothetical protein
MKMAKQKVPDTSLQALVHRAAEVEHQRRQLESVNGELTAEAYVRAALALPGADEKEVSILEEAITQPQNSMLRGSLTRMRKVILDFKRTSPVRKIAAYIDEEAASALGRLRCTYQSLFVVAAKQLVESRPEIWGEMSSPTEFEERHSKLLAERERLYAEIDATWARADLVIHRVHDNDRRDGKSLLSFKIAPGVFLVDGDRIGERLVTWWLNSPEHVAQLDKAA